MWVLATMAAAAAGGVLLLKLKVPGGMLVGAILGVAALNLLTEQAFMYSQARVLAQTLTGAFIGCMVTRQDVLHLPKLLRPFAMMLGALLVLNLGMAFFIDWVTDYDLLTCLFCASPSGISDTPLIAMDMGADGSVVAAMQFVRAVFGMGCLPSIILISDRLLEPDVAREIDHQAEELRGKVKEKKSGGEQATLKGFVPVFCVALVACIVGRASGLPAGGIAFAFLAAAALSISGKCHGMPRWLRRVAQVVSGCCIGVNMTREQLFQMRQLVVPMIALCLGYVVCCIGMGCLISKVCRIPLREAMLTMSPAGASEMALIAADLGVESPNLIVLQIGRLVTTLLVFPHIFNLVYHLAL